MKTLLIIICLFAILGLYVRYELKRAPTVPDDYEEDLDNFCPRHTAPDPEIKKDIENALSDTDGIKFRKHLNETHKDYFTNSAQY